MVPVAPQRWQLGNGSVLILAAATRVPPDIHAPVTTLGLVVSEPPEGSGRLRCPHHISRDTACDHRLASIRRRWMGRQGGFHTAAAAPPALAARRILR